MNECEHRERKETKIRTQQRVIVNGKDCYQSGWYHEAYCANSNCLKVLTSWHVWNEPECDR
jgi:hypothetical protein